VVIAVGNNKLWEMFCDAIGMNRLLEDPTYKDNYDRVKAHAEVKRIVEEWTGTRSVREVVDFLLSKAIPCAPLYTVKEVVEDPHIADARRMIREVDHPLAGRIKVIGSPIHLSETPAEVHAPAPLLGEHSVDILKGILNYPEERVAALRKDHII
jgi:formyl-CoA transferase